jgi:hypothetical protein
MECHGKGGEGQQNVSVKVTVFNRLDFDHASSQSIQGSTRFRSSRSCIPATQTSVSYPLGQVPSQRVDDDTERLITKSDGTITIDFQNDTSQRFEIAPTPCFQSDPSAPF